MLTFTIDQSEGISGADIPEQAAKKMRTGSAAPSLPSSREFFSYFWTTFHFHHHLGAWNRLIFNGFFHIKTSPRPGVFFPAEMIEKLSFDPYNFRITRLSEIFQNF